MGAYYGHIPAGTGENTDMDKASLSAPNVLSINIHGIEDHNEHTDATGGVVYVSHIV